MTDCVFVGEKPANAWQCALSDSGYLAIMTPVLFFCFPGPVRTAICAPYKLYPCTAGNRYHATHQPADTQANAPSPHSYMFVDVSHDSLRFTLSKRIGKPKTSGYYLLLVDDVYMSCLKLFTSSPLG